MGEQEWLPTSSYVVLGLLSFDAALTGYEIRQLALGTVRFLWAAPAMSQVYRELERLEAAGLVEAIDESEGSERARTTYRLTDPGLAELRRWVEDSPYEPPVIRHQVALRLFLGRIADRDKLVSLLEAHRDWAAGLIAELDEIDRNIGDDERWANAGLVARWGARFYGAEDSSTEAVVRELDERDP